MDWDAIGALDPEVKQRSRSTPLVTCCSVDTESRSAVLGWCDGDSGCGTVTRVWHGSTAPSVCQKPRGKNGQRHEVDFGDDPVRVEIYSSEETIEIFIGADFDTLPEECRRFAILNIPATGLAKPRARQRNVPQNPTNDEAVAVLLQRDHRPGGAAFDDFKLGATALFLAVSRGRAHLISTGDLLGECLEDPGQILLNGSDEQKQAMSRLTTRPMAR
jgi:hypothetical protein